MTQHWWMHWFWVTALFASLSAHPGAVAAPIPQEEHITSTVATQQEGRADRQGRAMYFVKTPSSTIKITTKAETKANNASITTNQSEIAHPSIQTTERPVTEDTNDTLYTTLPLDITNATAVHKRRNFTKLGAKGDVETAAESRIVTEKPLSLETTLLQTRSPDLEIDKDGRSQDWGVNLAAISGAVFGVVVLMALAGSTAFVLYRRRYLNKPQTLNDKCSNPDSSGYLDDSTIRDNSEEMYSLDNDSFLNSLEVMTFQNYWTDVKHTKL